MSRDLRAYTRQTNVRLIIGGIIILFVIGDGLILLFYGVESALMGLLCMGIGLVPVILIGILFWILDRLAHRINQVD